MLKLIKDKYGVYEIEGNYNRYEFTILTKDENCGRGEYAEEIDVRAYGIGQAKRIAQQVLTEEYISGLRIARVVITYKL